MDVELGWIVVELLPSGDLAWRGGDEWVWADAPPARWRGRRRRGLRLVVSGSVGGVSSGESGVGGSELVVAWSVAGLSGGRLLEVWR